MEQLLRTQMQARYGPERLGHFGLSLATYAHFTSPIRRYADLLVHRALVKAYRLGDGGLPPGDEERFEQIGEQISMLERRAMEAERETIDRYVAAFLADQVGQLVECRITGVQPFGFFATVEDLGGDGLVLAKDLGQEYFRYDEAARLLVGEETRRNLSRRAEADAPARRSQPGLRITALRAARGQLWRPLAAGQARPRANDWPPWPARQHPPPGSRPSLIFAMPPARNGGFEHGETVALGSLRAGLRLRTDPDRGRGRLADLVAQAHALRPRRSLSGSRSRLPRNSRMASGRRACSAATAATAKGCAGTRCSTSPTSGRSGRRT